MDDKPSPDAPASQYGECNIKKYAFVSKRALEADHIGYCYRDIPENKIDSGWRFLYGDEDEEYLDNPENCRSVYPDEMLSVSPAIEFILSAPEGSEFEWNDEREEFVEISEG